MTDFVTRGESKRTSQSSSPFHLVQNDDGDWIGLYNAQGHLIYEGHSISESQLLRLVGIPHTYVYDVDISDLGRMPAYLSLIADRGGKTEEVKP